MISQETVNELCRVLEGIDNCKETLEFLADGKERETQFIFIEVFNDEAKEKSASVFLSNQIAKEAVEKQLAALEEEYRELNKTAQTEVNQ